MAVRRDAADTKVWPLQFEGIVSALFLDSTHDLSRPRMTTQRLVAAGSGDKNKQRSPKITSGRLIDC